MPKPSTQLILQMLRRLTLSGGFVLVGAMGEWTDEYFGLVQGLCIAFLTLTVVHLADRGDSIHPKLLKHVCVLYCSRQARKLFIVNDNKPTSMFADLILALGLAAAAIVIYDEKTYNQDKTTDLRRIHESLIYMYGDVMDFLFEYGVLNITVCVFAFSMYLRTIKTPSTHMQRFSLRLVSMINANLLSQGMTTMIPSTSAELQILQCLAATCILRMMLPDMQYYFTFLATQQLMAFLPGAAPLFFCLVACLELLPTNSKEWINDICFTYVIFTLAAFTLQIPFWGMVFILMLAYYTDYIIKKAQ
jgi:hypothetical protein